VTLYICTLVSGGKERLTLNGSAFINCGVVVRQSKLPRSTRASNCFKALSSKLSLFIWSDMLSQFGNQRH
jgi:hypothetical protein